MTPDLKKLNKQLERVEKKLESCRATVLQDGWQTQKFARKSRNWDYYAQLKMKLIQEIEDLEVKQHYKDLINNSPEEQCPKCGEAYGDFEFDFQTCSKCGFDYNFKKQKL